MIYYDVCRQTIFDKQLCFTVGFTALSGFAVLFRFNPANP
jgi:hypothetical protein